MLATITLAALPGAAGCGESFELPSGSTSGTSTETASTTTTEEDPLAACGPVGEKWSRCEANPLWSAGHAHADGRVELSIGDPDVLYDEEDQLWKAWWSTGLAEEFLGPEEAIQMGIKYAESADGVAWIVQEDLALAENPGSDEWDRLKLETPSVVKVPANPPARRYVLAYSGAYGKKSFTVGGQSVEVPWYQVGIAFSPDGKHFTRLPEAESPYLGQDIGYPVKAGLSLLGVDMLAATPGIADGIVADPELLLVDGVLHLFTSSMGVDAEGAPLAFGVSHATSEDGVHWAAQPGNPQVIGGLGPSVVRDPEAKEYELFYLQDTDEDKLQEPSAFNPFLGAWRRTSPDLDAWSEPGAARDFMWDGAQKTEVYGLVAAGDMALRDGIHRYYYPGWSADDVPDGFLCPLHDGTLKPAVIVLNLALRR